jgi:HEPN domain-containing protein
MPRREHADLPMRKAAEDEHALDILVRDGTAAIETMGFLAQQATEKLLKAALVLAGVAPPFTHDLSLLLDLLHAAGLDAPVEVQQARFLTPFATRLRYGLLPTEGDIGADMASAGRVIRGLKQFVAQLMASAD